MTNKVCRIGQIAQAIYLLTICQKNTTITEINQKEMSDLAICIEERCAFWIEKCPQVEREDHSGGKEMIFDWGVKTNRTPYREGPGGSLGYWKLDAIGDCGLKV